MQRPSDCYELVALCRDWQCEGGPPPSPGAPGHGARIPGTHATRSLHLLAMLMQSICTHQQPNSRVLMPRSPQLPRELASDVCMSAASINLREWLRGAASHAVWLLHAWLRHVHVLPAALQARGAQRDRDRGGACRQPLVSLLLAPTPAQRHASGVHMHEQKSLFLAQ